MVVQPIARRPRCVTLEIERRALARGMTLKDASAYNIQLHEGPAEADRHAVVRKLSKPAGRGWRIGSFANIFWLRLALMSRVDVRLNQLLRIHLDGVPLDLASRLLPWRSRFNLSLGLHIHAHSRSQQKHAAAATSAGKVPNFSRRSFEAIFASLQNTVAGLKLECRGHRVGRLLRRQSQLWRSGNGRERSVDARTAFASAAADGLGFRRQQRPLQPDCRRVRSGNGRGLGHRSGLRRSELSADDSTRRNRDSSAVARPHEPRSRHRLGEPRTRIRLPTAPASTPCWPWG